MKTRRSRKSFEPPPPPRPRRRSKRKSGKGRPLKAVNETVVVLSDSEECVVNIADNDEIQVVDIADVSDAGSQEEEFSSDLLKTEVCRPDSPKGEGENIVFNPLAHSTVLPSPTRADSKAEPSATVVEPEVPVINIGDDESECATQNVDVDDDDDDGVEVIAVLVSSKKSQRLSRENKRKRSSIGERERKSIGNLSIMQDSIKRAKNVMRRSSSNNSNKNQVPANFPMWNGTGNPNAFPWNGISANSRQISRGKKKKKNKKFGRVWNQGQGWAPAPGPFNKNRSREFNREIIFRPESNTNPVEGISVNFANACVYPNPRFQPFVPVPFQGPSRGEVRGPWIPKIKRGTPPIAPGSNIMNAGEATVRPQGTLRPIVIDGSNVAVGHGGMLLGGGQKFSARGIKICVEYFIRRGHTEIVVFVPRFRLKRTECRDPELLEEMERAGHVRFTPSREAGGQRIASYDDLFVVQYAHETGGVIISNDNFKDLFDRNVHLRETIRFRLLQYTWITQDTLMFPEDPLGRNGPSLDEFLRF